MGTVGKAIKKTLQTAAAAVFILHGLAGPAGTQEHGHGEAGTEPVQPAVHAESIRTGNDEYVRLHGEEHRLIHSQGQNPELMVIQCADSRDDLVAQARLRAGKVFAVGTNAGNIINPNETALLANIKYHLTHFTGNRACIVMGHYGCGGIKGLDEWEHLPPEVTAHLRFALPAKEFVELQLQNRNIQVDEETRHRMIVEANVLAQIKNLMSIKAVRSAVEQRRLAVMPVISDINTGKLHVGLPTLQRHGLLEDAKAHFGIKKWLQSQNRLQDQHLARLGPQRPQTRRPAQTAPRNLPRSRMRNPAFRRAA